MAFSFASRSPLPALDKEAGEFTEQAGTTRWYLYEIDKNKVLEEPGEISPQDPDRAAAWELYVELLTRITTQYLAPEDGDEKTTLDSVHDIFPLTREILCRHGSGSGEFAKLAIPVLNQIIRPFTAKWHRLSLANAFSDRECCRGSGG